MFYLVPLGCYSGVVKSVVKSPEEGGRFTQTAANNTLVAFCPMTSLDVVKGWSVSLVELGLQEIRTAVGDLALLGMTSYRECAEMWYRSQHFVVGLGGLPALVCSTPFMPSVEPTCHLRQVTYVMRVFSSTPALLLADAVTESRILRGLRGRCFVNIAMVVPHPCTLHIGVQKADAVRRYLLRVLAEYHAQWTAGFAGLRMSLHIGDTIALAPSQDPARQTAYRSASSRKLQSPTTLPGQMRAASAYSKRPTRDRKRSA
jgi:hypothetical protein